MENSIKIPQIFNFFLIKKMIRQFYFWVRIQKNTKQELIEIFAHYIHYSTTHSGKRRKQTKCPFADGWIKKMWYTHIIEYCEALRKKKVKKKKEEYFAICYNINELVIKGETLYDSIHMKYLKLSKSNKQKVEIW